MGTNSQQIEALERTVGTLMEEMGGMPSLRDRVQSLERNIQAVPPGDASGSSATLLDRIQALEEGLQTLQGNPPSENFGEMIDEMRDEIHRINQKLVVVSMAVANSPVGGGERTKMKVPEPKAFTGVRDARELENFIFVPQRSTQRKLKYPHPLCTCPRMPSCGGETSTMTFKLVIARSAPGRT